MFKILNYPIFWFGVGFACLWFATQNALLMAGIVCFSVGTFAIAENTSRLRDELINNHLSRFLITQGQCNVSFGKFMESVNKALGVTVKKEEVVKH